MITRFSRHLKFLLLTVVFLAATACSHAPVIPDRTTGFENGIRMLAGNLAAQLEQATIGNMVDKVISQLPSKRQQKKITIDPFIDAESGYPLKANLQIRKLVASEMNRRFDVTGEMDPENLEASEYILSGLVTLDNKVGHYRVCAAIFEKSSGQVLAAASVQIDNVDTTPLNIYRDSPVFLRGMARKDHLVLIKNASIRSASKSYRNSLKTKALLVKGDLLYEKQEYQQSLSCYDQAARTQDDPELEVLNGKFTTLVKQGRLEEAGQVYAGLLRAGIAESDQILNKIFFAPNSVSPLESEMSLYRMYIKQIGSFVGSTPRCRVQIIGHCSRSGSEAYNDRLSRQRAEWIYGEMAAYAPKVKSKAETLGRGFRENLVGTGKDDITDAIDRRVEFKFSDCDSTDENSSETEPEKDEGQEEGTTLIEKVSQPSPLEVEDIEYYLKNKVSSKMISKRIAERGVSFELNEQVRKRLKKSKADSRIFRAIEHVNGKRHSN